MSLSDPPLFPCLECQARGRPRQEFQLRDLEEHLGREHFGISYYFCPKCKQDFVTKAKVSEHIKTVCKLERIPQTEEFTKNILHYDQEVFKLIDRCLTQAIAYRSSFLAGIFEKNHDFLVENPLNLSNLLKNEEKINENGETQPKTKNMVVKQEPREETRQMGPDAIKETAENENSGKETTTPIKQEVPESQEGPEAEKSQEIPQEPIPVQEQLIPVPGPSCLSANLQNLLDIHFSKTFSMPNTEFSEPEPNQTGNGCPMPNIGAPSGQTTSNPGEMGPGTNQMGEPPPQLTLMTSTPLKKAPGSSHSPQSGPRANKMSRMTVSSIQSPSLVPTALQMGTVSSELPPLGPRANEIAPGPAQACPTGPKGPQSGFGPSSIPQMGPEANQMGQPQSQMTQKAPGLSPLQQKGPGVNQAGPAPRPIPTIGTGPPQLTQIDPGPSLRGLEANYLPQMGPGAPFPPFGPGFPPFGGVFGPPQLEGWPYRPPHSGPGHFEPGTIFPSSMGLSGPYSNPQPSGFPPGPIGHPLSLMPEEARRLLAEISITVPGYSISSKIPGTKGKEPATEGPTAEKASKNSKEPEKAAPVAPNGPNPLVPAESSKKAVKDQPKPANPPEKQDDIVARPTSAAEPAKIKKNRRRTRAATKARKALKKAKPPPAKKTRKIQNAEKRKQSAVDESPPAKNARKEEPKSAEKSSPMVKYPAKQPVTRPLFEPGYKIPVRRTFILPRPSSSASKELESAVVPSNEKEGSFAAPGPELGISGVECRVPMEEAVAPPQISPVLQEIHLQIPIKPEPFEADPERSPPASPPLEITVPPLGPVFPPTEGGEGGQPSPSSSSRRPRITPPSPERARIHRRISPPTQEFQPRGRSRRGVAVPIFDPELDDLELFDEIGAEEEEISLVDSGQPLPLPIRIGLKVEEDADEMGEQPQDEGREGQEQPRPSPPIPSLLDLPPLGRSISRRDRILPPAGGSRMGAEEEYQNDGYIEEEIVIQFPEHVCEYSNCCSEPHLNHPCPFCNGYHRPSDCATITNIWERKVACFFNQHCIRCLGMHPLLNKTSCKKMTCVHCRMSNHPTALCTAFKNKNYRKTLDKCRELCVLPLSPEIITSVQKRYLNLIKVQPDQWGNPHLIAPHQ